MSCHLGDLSCYICEIWEFDSYDEFLSHHQSHVRQSTVPLAKLGSKLFGRLYHKGESYRLNTGVARRTISPIKISRKTVKGKRTFVVKPNFTLEADRSTKKNNTARNVEGNNGPLERLSASISFKRRGSKSDAPPARVTREDSVDKSASSPDSTSEKGNENSNGPTKQSLLEKLSGLGGISIGKKGKEDSAEEKPAGLMIASKSNSLSIDIEAYRGQLRAKMAENKVMQSPGNLLAKLPSGISFASKGGGAIKTESEKEKEPAATSRKSSSEDDETDNSDDDDEPLKKPECRTVTPPFPKTEVPTSSEPKVRVSTNLFAVKEEKPLADVKVKPMSELVAKTEVPEEKVNIIDAEVDVKDNTMGESAVNILERLTERLNEGQLNSVPKKEPQPAAAQSTVDDDDDDIIMEEEIPNSKRSLVVPKSQLPSPTPSEQLHPDFLAPATDVPPVMTGQLFQSENPEQLHQQPMPGYTDVSCLDSYSANQTQLILHSQLPPVNVGDKGLQEGQQQNSVDYGALTTVNPSLTGEVPPLAGNGYWTEIGSAPPGMEQPQQDPLMTADGQVGATEAMNQAFLQNFLNEQQQQAVQHGIPNEGSEFVSLDRLGQGGLNTGVPQQHIPPQQPSPSYDQQQQQLMASPGMTHTMQPGMQGTMQPVMQANMSNLPSLQPAMQGNLQAMSSNMQQGMPQLFPGFNVYNQQFPTQQPQQQPPMLQPRPPQQRPQITPRSFQSMAAIPRGPRAPRMGVKRTMMRMPHPQEMTPPKQKKIMRMPSPSNVSPQQNRSPVNNQVTPPKKTAEANKVANVLASRGITVTASPNRQQSSPKSLNPALLNLSSQISVTPSSQNRTSGGFAVPGSRRSLLNNNVERPERCTTVDLTLDDEPQQRRIMLGRFPCNICSKTFTSSVALESHKSSHRAAGTLAYKCDKCSAQYPSQQGLNHHKITFHKNRPAPDLAIPIVDITHPGAKEQLQRCGFNNFLPLSQLQSNSSGVYGMPIINLDSAKEKVVSTLNSLGASNIFVLGKMKPLSSFSSR